MIKKIFNELLSFLKNPKPDLSDSKISINPVKLFFMLFGINLIIGLFILSTISSFVRIAFHISFRPIDISMFQLLIANIVFIPVFEEVAFRLPLKFSKWNISLSLSVIAFFICSYFLGIAPVNVNNYLTYRLIISALIFVCLFILLSKHNIYEIFKDLIANNYKLFFYTLLLLFTLRHIDNYQLTLITLLFLPILLLPQLIGGFFLAYTRLKINFISAIIFHFLINIIAFLPQLLGVLL